MLDLHTELEFLKESRDYLLLKKGVSRALVFILSFCGNVAALVQAISMTTQVILDREAALNLFLWYPILAVIVVVTPKILDLGKASEQAYIKFYTFLVYAGFSISFIVLLMEVFYGTAYIENINLTEEVYSLGENFHHINSLMIVYVSCAAFTFYFKKGMPKNYLNAGTMPMIIVLMSAVFYTVFFGEPPELRALFQANETDGYIRLSIFILSVFIFSTVVKSTLRFTEESPEKGENTTSEVTNNEEVKSG